MYLVKIAHSLFVLIHPHGSWVTPHPQLSSSIKTQEGSIVSFNRKHMCNDHTLQVKDEYRHLVILAASYIIMNYTQFDVPQ